MILKPGDLPVLTALLVPTGDREVFREPREGEMEAACQVSFGCAFRSHYLSTYMTHSFTGILVFP